MEVPVSVVVTLVVKACVCSRVVINMSVEALSIDGWADVMVVARADAVVINALDADVIIT